MAGTGTATGSETGSDAHRIDVAVVGLGFGAEFVPLYQHHPGVGRVAIVDLDESLLRLVGERHRVEHRFGSLAELLATDGWDAVHVATQVTTHGDLALQVLESGRHCASAVPMALRIDQMEAIVAASRRGGRAYMMMETAVFAREFRYVEALLAGGELGELTYYKGSHIQNHDNYPAYWTGFPPMLYATHALSPALALTGSRVTAVSCRGSGRLTSAQQGGFDNTFPVEIGLFELEDNPMVAEITMSWYGTARPYQEGFSVYGTRASVEWPQLEGDPMTRFTLQAAVPGRRGLPSRVDRVRASAHLDGLPDDLVPFAGSDSHGGSHPHLVHEFISAVLEERPPRVDAQTAAEWTAPGVCAHRSAQRGGASVEVPRFR